MCTGRVDLAFVIRAFAQGADGVIIGGCWPGECHYVTEGNYDALANMHLCRKLMRHIGLNPDRLQLDWIAASEGGRFAEVMSDFAAKLRDLGPVGRDEGLEETEVASRLEALSRLVPFVKLVEREKLRAPTRTEEAYNEFYASDEVNRIFDELIAEPLAVTRILLALEEKPLSTGEIAEVLGLSPSEVSKHMMTSSRQGFVRFDLDEKRYALA
jgi:coenzyme F420-reducing hydrogenase delta subunit/biotin operon repressor